MCNNTVITVIFRRRGISVYLPPKSVPFSGDVFPAFKALADACGDVWLWAEPCSFVVEAQLEGLGYCLREYLPQSCLGVVSLGLTARTRTRQFLISLNDF